MMPKKHIALCNNTNINRFTTILDISADIPQEFTNQKNILILEISACIF